MNGNGSASKRSEQIRPIEISMTDSTEGPMPTQLQRGHQINTVKFNQSSATRAQALASKVPYVVLLPLNDTFDPKTIRLPFLPDVVKIGRQTNKSTVPYQDNGFFDSKVLSRSHAEMWANAEGRACIKDVRSSNGTFVNGIRLSKENEESDVRELLPGDTLELGIDILNDENGTITHRKVSARVDHAGFLSDNWADQQGEERLRHGTNGNGPLTPSIQQSNGSRAFYDNASNNGSSVSLSSMATNASHFGTGRHNVTIDMVIRKLSNDLKVSRKVSSDLKSTTEAFTTCLSGGDPITFPKASPFARTTQSGLSKISAAGEAAQSGIGKELNTKEQIPDVTDPLSQQLQAVRLDLETREAKVQELELALLREREERMIMEENWKTMLDAPTQQLDDCDDRSDTSEDTLLYDSFEPVDNIDASSTSEQPPVGMDEVSSSNGGGVVERLENLLRNAQDEICAWKMRAETAESQNTSQASKILELVAQLERAKNMPSDSGSSPDLTKIIESGQKLQRNGSSTQDKSVVKTGGEELNGRGGRGAALVSMMGVVMLGIGLMAFLKDHGPKKEF